MLKAPAQVPVCRATGELHLVDFTILLRNLPEQFHIRSSFARPR